MPPQVQASQQITQHELMAKPAGSKANALANTSSKSRVHTKANRSIIEVETIHTGIERIYIKGKKQKSRKQLGKNLKHPFGETSRKLNLEQKFQEKKLGKQNLKTKFGRKNFGNENSKAKTQDQTREIKILKITFGEKNQN